MKKTFIVILTLLLVSLSVPFSDHVSAEETPVRGVWVSSVFNIDYPSAPGLSDEQLRQEADNIISNCVATGMNVIYFQVRPCADALYNSTIFPKSRYLTGGGNGYLSFDPLAYMVELAHANGIQLHAWLNPYRVTTHNGDDLNLFPANSPQRLHPEYLMRAGDGNYFFNPALQEVRDLITAGVVEILDNYNVDGIHFDDYFYPDTSFDDSAQFAASSQSDLTQWRIESVNALVKQVSEAVHARGSVFGISPRGIWANANENALGSATNGGGSLNSIYCDSLRFIKEGWVDYICPQIYWNIGFEIADYAILVPWWCEAVKDTDVNLYIGMADYRIPEAKAGSVWSGTAELARQLELNKSYPAVKGDVHFSYGSIVQNPDIFNFYVSVRQTAPSAFMPVRSSMAFMLKQNIVNVVKSLIFD